jgi:pimeloyl-ACP methyl ester carboxylesterase
MQTNFLSFGSSRLSYSCWGRGDKLLLCFHGYGESAASFAFLEACFGHEFTILAIDMPFHGETEWEEGLFFNPSDLQAIVKKIVSGLPGLRKGWWLLGYSMGGRVALQLLELIPDKVERLLLVAPDGLKMNGWYWLATQTRWGNRLFRWTMQYPGWFFLILRACNKLRLVNRSIYKFTFNYIGDKPVRNDLFRRWTTMRAFRPDIEAIRSLIREKQIPVRLLYGQYDRIIRWETGEKFCKGIEPYGKLEIAPAGHQLLQAKHMDELAFLFNP